MSEYTESKLVMVLCALCERVPRNAVYTYCGRINRWLLDMEEEAVLYKITYSLCYKRKAVSCKTINWQAVLWNHVCKMCWQWWLYINLIFMVNASHEKFLGRNLPCRSKQMQIYLVSWITTLTKPLTKVMCLINALPFRFIVNKTKPPFEWRLELNCALMFFKPKSS